MIGTGTSSMMGAAGNRRPALGRSTARDPRWPLRRGFALAIISSFALWAMIAYLVIAIV